MMPPSHTALLEACRALEPLLRADRDCPAPAEAAQIVAQSMRRLAPGAPAYACLLQADGSVEIGLSDESGNGQPRYGKALRDMLKREASAAATCLPVARTDKLPGQALAVQPLEIPGQRVGILAILLPKATDDAGLRNLLQLFAQHVSLTLAWRRERAVRAALEQQLAEETRRGDIGELVGPALHEVGNFINSVFLTLAVVERKVPAKVHGDFTGLRKQGHAVAAVAGHIQQTRRAPAGPPIDLNVAVREALAGLESGGGDEIRHAASTELCLAPTELLVGSRCDVKRLCRFLLKNAAAAAGPGGSVTVATQSSQADAVLRVVDHGPRLTEEQVHHFWDVNESLARPGTNPLELATCWSLCKRLGGKLEVQNCPDNGVAVTVRLPLAS